MVPDFVDQGVFDDGRERKIVIAPIGEERLSIEKDHVGLIAHRFQAMVVADRHAVIEAEQIVRAFQLHRGFSRGIGEILDLDHDAAEMPSEGLGETSQDFLADPLEILHRRRRMIESLIG